MPNPTSLEFAEHSEAITAAAVLHYHALQDGVEADQAASRINVLPQDLGDLSPAELAAARVTEARVNSIAYAVGRLCEMSDKAEAKGIGSWLVRVELKIAPTIEALFGSNHAKEALKPGGLVDTIRGVDAQ